MPRKARLITPGIPHHITQRGNRKTQIFCSIRDREIYLRLLKANIEHHGIELLAYCLMSNHIHLIAVPPNVDSFVHLIRNTHSTYARYFNSCNGFTGHLVQNRFFSTPVEEAYIWQAIRYVERNPVRARIVDRAENYRWSSAAAHCGLRDDPILCKTDKCGLSFQDWRYCLTEPDQPQTLTSLRENTLIGRKKRDRGVCHQMEKRDRGVCH